MLLLRMEMLSFISDNSQNVGFPSGSDGKASVCNAGNLVQSLGWEDPLEKEMAAHSCLENPMDHGAW